MRIENLAAIVGKDPKELTEEQIEKRLNNYRKFQSKVNRITEFAHVRRMMSRMEYQQKKEAEERKSAAGKKKTVA